MKFSETLMHHLEWKVRLRAAINEHRTHDVRDAGDYRCCTLGGWLDGPARALYGDLDCYRSCYEKHVRFHDEAGKVVQCIDTGNETEARIMLGLSGSFSQASNALIESMKQLQQDANLGN
jgi:methyl-accepting chemotaxis protein